MRKSNKDLIVVGDRVLTPTEKLAIVHSLRRTAWQLSVAGIRERHPYLTEDEVTRRAGALFLRARP